jgi:hypothetical protein
MGETRNAFKILVAKPERKEDPHLDGEMILVW